MSYKKRKAGAAHSNALLLLELIKDVDERSAGFHDRVGANVLKRFCELEGNVTDNRFFVIRNSVPCLDMPNVECGTKVYSKADFLLGKLEEPEKFFLTRYSLREFSPERVALDQVKRAISLAMKSPSSCNMQPWHCYILSTKEVIDKALSMQSGNRGFGHTINGLIIVACDQSAFISSSERYQHWIDGGMFAMSLCYAFHATGIASCCLNWSEDPRRDKQLRNALGISKRHSVIMMVAYGYPEAENKVCMSPRRPMHEIITEIA